MYFFVHHIRCAYERITSRRRQLSLNFEWPDIYTEQSNWVLYSFKSLHSWIHWAINKSDLPCPGDLRLCLSYDCVISLPFSLYWMHEYRVVNEKSGRFDFTVLYTCTYLRFQDEAPDHTTAGLSKSVTYCTCWTNSLWEGHPNGHCGIEMRSRNMSEHLNRGHNGKTKCKCYLKGRNNKTFLTFVCSRKNVLLCLTLYILYFISHSILKQTKGKTWEWQLVIPLWISKGGHIIINVVGVNHELIGMFHSFSWSASM